MTFNEPHLAFSQARTSSPHEPTYTKQTLNDSHAAVAESLVDS